MKGKFIVVYGMNNIGKTTATGSLVDYLNNHGIKAEYLKYPIYNSEPTGSRINAYLRKGNPEHLTPFQAQEIYAQNRRDYQLKLQEILESGVWVVAEDYIGTGIGWGMIFGEPQEELERLNIGLLPANVSVLMDGERFGTGVEKGHLHEGDDRWEQGRRLFQSLAGEYGWVVMNSEGTKEEVLERLVGLVEGKFPGCVEREVSGVRERK